jgi:cytidyltransferase-like protein
MSLGYLACSFDLLNVGHLDLIAQARELCDRLIVGVYTDEAIERADGRPPVTPLAERAALVGHVRGVDEVVVHETVPVRGAAATLVLVDDAGSRTVTVREIELAPRRETASAVLLAALQPSHAEAEPISA